MESSVKDSSAQPGEKDNTTAAPGTSAPSADSCPRCSAKLVNPEALGWCPKCGYSKAMEQEDQAKAIVLETQRDPSKVYASDVVEWIRAIPHWGWVLASGCFAIFIVSLAAAVVLPNNMEDESFFYRALWTTIQYGVGFLAVVLAQMWFIFLVGMKDEQLGPLDCIIVSARTWKTAWRRLPETRWPFWLIAWAMTATTGAGLIGGMGYWLNYLPEPKEEVNPMLAELARQGGEDKSLEEAVKDFTEQALQEEKDREKASIPEILRRQRGQAVVVGYLEDEDKRITGLVLAAVYEREFSLRYAGILRFGVGLQDPPDHDPDLKPTVQDRRRLEHAHQVLARLPELVVDAPGIAGMPAMADAVWVEPKVFCLIAFDGIDKGSNTLKNLLLLEFLQAPEG